MTNQTNQTTAKAIAESLLRQVVTFITKARPASLLKMMTSTTGGLLCAELDEDGEDATLVVFNDDFSLGGRPDDVFDLELGGLIAAETTLQDMQTYAGHWGVELPAAVLTGDDNSGAFDEWFLQTPAAQAGARQTLLEDVENADLEGVVAEMLAQRAEEEEED